LEDCFFQPKSTLFSADLSSSHLCHIKCEIFHVNTIDINKFYVYLYDMELQKSKRPYRMSGRAQQVARNEQQILEAAVSLWKELSINEITLEKVAERAGVTVRTILRKYGSKEGLIEACAASDAPQIRKTRSKAPKGDVVAALKILLDNYEENGDASIRTLAVEGELPIAHKILNRARAYHRDWCAHVFEPYLPPLNTPEYEIRLLAFITATEFYLWKLLRRDLHKSYDETFAVFQSLSEGLIQKFNP
jgi:AcrR family transcriptional regulator